MDVESSSRLGLARGERFDVLTGGRAESETRTGMLYSEMLHQNEPLRTNSVWQRATTFRRRLTLRHERDGRPEHAAKGRLCAGTQVPAVFHFFRTPQTLPLVLLFRAAVLLPAPSVQSFGRISLDDMNPRDSCNGRPCSLACR
jgi:hypothetical protein